MSKLQPGAPVTIGGTTVVPVEKTSVHTSTLRRGFWLHGVKEPVAVVICRPNNAQAFDMLGHTLPFEDLLRDVPDLGPIVERLTRSGNRPPCP
jgi:hypothetical protein